MNKNKNYNYNLHQNGMKYANVLSILELDTQKDLILNTSKWLLSQKILIRLQKENKKFTNKNHHELSIIFLGL